MTMRISIRAVLRAAAVLTLILTSCAYMKVNPPPDADKPTPISANDFSCWQATAANMLAAAGYGNGATMQARADDIYADMLANYGTVGGWTDSALTWWLASTNNTWAGNPYTVVTVYGNKVRVPWANASGTQFLANELRRCQMLGISISWPLAGPGADGGHAITGWGDEGPGSAVRTTDPETVRVTDSDRDTGGDLQVYDYDAYTNPNPGGANEGNGWYFDYGANHPFIKHIVTLCPTDDPSDATLTQKVVGSYEIHQNQKTPATDLHYDVGTDVDILSYRTWLDRLTAGPPTITEDGPPRRNLTVDWDFAKNPVPYCTRVKITTEFVLPRWNAIKYRNVHFTYPDDGTKRRLPDLEWRMDTPMLDRPTNIPDITGGYVVGSFEIIDPSLPEEQQRVAEYRFLHQYSFDQDPERHAVTIRGTEGHVLANVRFGHSYGYLSEAELWRFRRWMSEASLPDMQLSEKGLQFNLDWKGRLPYPKGEDYVPGKK